MTRRFPALASLAVLATLAAAPEADAAKVQRVPVSRISTHIVEVNGQSFVPLADVAKAAGCTLAQHDEKLGDGSVRAYEAWPCKGGLLQVNVEGLSLAGREAPGALQGFDPQPEPPALLRIDSKLVSRQVLTVSGDPHLPLAEVARLLGGKLQTKRGKTSIVVKGDGGGLLVVAGH